MKVDSKHLKFTTINWLLYQKSFLCAFTEFFNGADVLGIKRSLFTREVEIKVSRSDLMGELNSIERIKSGEIKTKNCAKLWKHDHNLTRVTEEENDNWHKPNEFCFLVPQKLMELTRDYIKDTPYGLMYFKEEELEFGEIWVNIEEEVPPKKIHKFKFNLDDHKRIWRKACTETQILREKELNYKWIKK